MTESERKPFLNRVAPDHFPASWPKPPVSWPATLPPFEGNGAPMPTPDGRLLVQRLHAAADTGVHYDVIDRRGVLVGQLVVPGPLRLLSFGARSVYLAPPRDDASHRLERHPWP